MHATIPAMPAGIHHILKSGIRQGETSGNLKGLLNRTEGILLASGMATAIRLGFGYLTCRGPDKDRAAKAEQFFKEQFIMTDPNVKGGKRYYQGQLLIRTKKPDDDMNVWIRFCPDPTMLFEQTLIGPHFNPDAVVATQVVSEAEAEQIEHDPNRCDLVIRFRDSKAILGLIERPDADVVQLLLENLVQITGNFGHMFKFGAIGNRARVMLTD
ncbi:MAG: hypothetical protein R8K50_07350 [Mariprofundus sp.]